MASRNDVVVDSIHGVPNGQMCHTPIQGLVLTHPYLGYLGLSGSRSLFSGVMIKATVCACGNRLQ